MREVEVITHRWCDHPAHGEDRVEAGTERTVSLDGSEQVLLDLCAPHDSVFQDLEELLANGNPAPVPESRPGKDNTTCPICGRTSGTRSALGQHLKKIHGTGIKAAGA